MSIPFPSLASVAYSIIWMVVMLLYDPFSEALAARLVNEPVKVDPFEGMKTKKDLFIRTIGAWVLGGFGEGFLCCWFLLQTIEFYVGFFFSGLFVYAFSLLLAALLVNLIGLFQGKKAYVANTQHSILFGVLFYISGRDIWAVILCHGLYDTFRFVRYFVRKSSKGSCHQDRSTYGEMDFKR